MPNVESKIKNSTPDARKQLKNYSRTISRYKNQDKPINNLITGFTVDGVDQTVMKLATTIVRYNEEHNRIVARYNVRNTTSMEVDAPIDGNKETLRNLDKLRIGSPIKSWNQHVGFVLCGGALSYVKDHPTKMDFSVYKSTLIYVISSMLKAMDKAGI